MNTFFPIAVLPEDFPAISELQYFPEFITSAEKIALASAINAAIWGTSWTAADGSTEPAMAG
jgi:hypothetical protein